MDLAFNNSTQNITTQELHTQIKGVSPSKFEKFTGSAILAGATASLASQTTEETITPHIFQKTKNTNLAAFRYQAAVVTEVKTHGKDSEAYCAY